jgi:ferredoxin-NADP reductase
MSADRGNQIDSSGLIDVRLSAIREAAYETKLYHFEAVDRAPLPSASAGAHIDLHLANGLIRQYSLVLENRPASDYVVAVKLDAAGRGGSAYMHRELRVGTTLKISEPRNNFPLNETAEHSVLIAGGIGITPIFSMIQRLLVLNTSWELYYACRSRADMAFLQALPRVPSVHLHFDDESGGAYLDLKQIVMRAPANAHFYCCGPLPLMAAFETAAATLPAEQKHVEYFTPKEARSLKGGFVVRLAKSGKTLTVCEGQTILDVVTEAGIAVEHSCTEGICGTCETKVLAGIPEHRDSLLSPAERASNNTMMICCSGSKTEELVLDL